MSPRWYWELAVNQNVAGSNPATGATLSFKVAMLYFGMGMHGTSEAYNAYMRKYMLKRYHDRRESLIAALGGKCVRCGSKEKLQFDHVDFKSKKWGFAKRIHTASTEDVAKEIGKAQLLCDECHRLKTTLERGQSPAAHGSITMYTHYRCRCAKCREVANAYSRHYRANKKASVAQ